MKIGRIILFGFLLVMIIALSLNISAESKINVKKEGIKASSTMNFIDSETTVLKEGEAVTGKFKAGESFMGEITTENEEIIKLVGKLVSSNNGEKYTYKGTVNSSSNKTFNAMLYLDKTTEKFDAVINIETYKSSEHIELKNGETYIFDGSSPKVTKNTNYDAMNDYYNELRDFNGFYQRTVVEGPSEIGKGQSDYHSLRSTTKTDKVNEYWENKGYIVDHTLVREYDLELSTYDAAAFDTVSPEDDNEETFNIPFYIKELGIISIPVTTDGVSIDGTGTENLSYSFTNLFYIDDGSPYEETDRGFGARYEVDTAKAEIDSNLRIHVESDLLYHSYAYDGYDWVYAYHNGVNNFYYDVPVTD
ncbi:hypothetical protein [Tenuibacillus multivorans]|uniref:Uncharacterized protein n=1 Tax=Tenuibacillus multivorans TaxID=237069 RepID=A0A1G9ZPJ4_9BACI|nr:hypothetical protein [Tenuibacillus multivorans]GEL76790.1 hypothetical protein TMU01_10250 [Tenuibacillus multivorans]SDN22997.1 hypothetical protein SAMN05216498_1784 [Tenuibacillus multivorans]